MKRHLSVWVLALVLGFALAAFAGVRDVRNQGAFKNGTQVERAVALHPTHHARRSPLDENIFYENWSTGDLHGWTPIDLTASPSTWHIDTWNAFGGTGHSWWVGDTTTGVSWHNGYTNAQYFVLNSPQIQLPATNPGMVFWHRYSCEPPQTHDGPEGHFDGWDGMNLRISTNGGTTWSIVTAVTPYYDADSLFSFGFQHGEGPGIPGWCGANTTWHPETINLSAWAGQTVMLRWAFASDPGECTGPSHPDWFGWEIDNIRVYQTGATDTVFTTNCDAVGQWTTQNLLTVGGNLWRIATDNTAPDDPHILVCNNAGTNLYNANMNTVIESPDIDVTGYGNGQLIADVMVTGAVQGAAYPDADFWGMEVSTDGGEWCAVSNPTCLPSDCNPPDYLVCNYVYSDCPTTWTSFNAGYDPDIDLSALLGHHIKFRFTFQSNGDALVDVGPKFDAFTIDYSPGAANDVACYTLQVRYPNIANQPFKIKGYFQNVGQNAENDVSTYYAVLGSTTHLLGSFSTLNPAQYGTQQNMVTISTPVRNVIRAWSGLANDGNTANDTSVVENVFLQPAGAQPELGYDNRSVNDTSIQVPTDFGPLVRFTPASDTIVSGTYDLTSIAVQYSSAQNGAFPIHYYVYTDNGGVPGTLLWDEQETVNQNETCPGDSTPTAWKTVNTASVSALHGLTGNFFVWLKTVSTTPYFPHVIGNTSEPWSDNHFFVWNGSTAPAASQYFFRIHATISSTEAVSDNNGVIPTRWTLDQNYPNPFNPTTEIRYSVPRADHITLKVFNLIGQEVATLVNEQVSPGTYTAHFDASKLPSGVYVYRLEASSFTSAHKMLLLK